jgi:FkbH-like protein
MYQLEWGKTNDALRNYLKSNVFNEHIILNDDTGTREMITCWEEHCLECAPPLCYQTCEKYEARSDLKCKNFSSGITLVKELNNRGNIPVFIQFKEWAKLETYVTNVFYKKNTISILNKLNISIVSYISLINKILPVLVNKRKRLNGFYYYMRDLFLKQLNGVNSSQTFFRIDAYLLNYETVRFKIESDGYNGGFQLTKGFNSISLPISLNEKTLLRIFPENNFRVDVIITKLEINPSDDEYTNPKQIVKCVVWDLDNTLWNGILTEGNIELKSHAIDTIVDLDNKGILQSICSKNNFEEAINKLEELGIREYFLFPEINWNPKSLNIRNIAQSLNIGLDSILFIDDSSFERAEVKQAIPIIKVENELYFPGALKNDLFDFPITETSRLRRRLYVTESNRRVKQQEFGDDYIEFLRDSQLVLSLKRPKTIEEMLRSKELLQRTNQLNLSTRRFTDIEFATLIEDSQFEKFIFSVSDKYGDYGIVGFLSLKVAGEILVIEDLVISCRVVQKMVENTLLKAIFDWQNNTGRDVREIHARYNETPRNSPILNSFLKIGFEKLNDGLIIDARLLDVDDLPVAYVFNDEIIL